MRKFLIFALAAWLLTSTTEAFAISELVSIDLSSIPLSSKLKKDYAGYKYVVTNTSSNDINLVNAQIINGADGATGFAAVDDGSGVGTLWAIMGPVGLFSLGIGWAVGLLLTPVMLITNGGKNKKAKSEGQAFSNIVNLGIMKSGDSTTFQTLVPIGAKPQLKLTVQNPNTKELEMVSR
jgi:hypothetical protein